MEQYRQTEEIKSAEVKAYYIPARAKEEIYNNTKIRVCAYCRVSTDSDCHYRAFGKTVQADRKLLVLFDFTDPVVYEGLKRV